MLGCWFVWLHACLLYFGWLPSIVNGRGSCPTGSLVIYELHLETLWHRKDFPKHYPEWRPPASWSKMLGFTHSSNFSVYHKGEYANDALKQYLKSNQVDLFDQHTQGFGGVYDRFAAAAIKSGVGESKLRFNADANHAKVSLISKLMPSPDWFIGIDSYDLCPNGEWLQIIHFETTPLDGGTDNGMTFSSPEWPTIPQEKIQPITAHFPSHPAGSFNYPELDGLPPIAQITIKKTKEYILTEAPIVTEIGHFVPGRRDIYRYEIADNSMPPTPHMDNSFFAVLNDDSEDRSENEIPSSFQSPRRKNQNTSRKKSQNKYSNRGTFSVSTTTIAPTTIEVTEPGLTNKNAIITVGATSLPKDFAQLNSSMNEKGRRRIPGGDVMSVMDDIVKDYQKVNRKMIRKMKKQRKRRRKQLKKIRPPRDCRVAEWSKWSPCSKTCGIGEQSRTRAQIKRARRGGKPCPTMLETTWCGSARTCKRNYFNWSE